MARVLITGMSGAGKSTLLAALAPVVEVEPLIRRTATLELDGRLPVEVLADRVEQCLRTAGATDPPSR